jgi:hypothetical protein
VNEDEVHVLTAELMSGLKRLRRGIDEPEIDYLYSIPGQAFMHATDVALQSLLKAFKLRPILFETDSK